MARTAKAPSDNSKLVKNSIVVKVKKQGFETQPISVGRFIGLKENGKVAIELKDGIVIETKNVRQLEKDEIPNFIARDSTVAVMDWAKKYSTQPLKRSKQTIKVKKTAKNKGVLTIAFGTDLDKVRSRVRNHLVNSENCRNSDRYLLVEMWKEEMKAKSIAITPDMRKFLNLVILGEVSNTESIRRSRQLIQAKEVKLRGKEYGKRKQHSDKVLEQVRG